MAAIDPPPSAFGRELRVLAAAVVTGGVGAALARPFLAGWLGAESAGTVALALATMLTAATHARLAHRQPLRIVLPHAVVSGPIVYLAMRAVHLFVN